MFKLATLMLVMDPPNALRRLSSILLLPELDLRATQSRSSSGAYTTPITSTRKSSIEIDARARVGQSDEPSWRPVPNIVNRCHIEKQTFHEMSN